MSLIEKQKKSLWNRKYRETHKDTIKEKQKICREKPENKEKQKKYQVEYYKKNKEIILQKDKNWRINNAEKTREKSKEYREKNKNRCNQLSREYRQKNREHCIKVTREWTKKNREHINQISNLYYHYKADKKKIEARWRAKCYGIKKSFCENCGGIEKLQHHHSDYDKPLVTITLCQSCHMNIHR